MFEAFMLINDSAAIWAITTQQNAERLPFWDIKSLNIPTNTPEWELFDFFK